MGLRSGKLLVDLRPYILAAYRPFRQHEDPAAVALALPQLADGAFLRGVGALRNVGALVFDHHQAVVVHSGDEVGVELAAGCGQPKGLRVPCDVPDPESNFGQGVDHLSALGFLAVLGAVESGDEVGAEEMLDRPPMAAMAGCVAEHPVLELEGVVERNFDTCGRLEQEPSIDGLAFRLPDGGDPVLHFAREDELAAHQRADRDPPRDAQVMDEFAQPSQQIALAYVRLTHLPVKPDHQRFRGPAFHVHVERQLVILGREAVGDASPVEVDLEVVCRFAHCKFGLVQIG